MKKFHETILRRVKASSKRSWIAKTLRPGILLYRVSRGIAQSSDILPEVSKKGRHIGLLLLLSSAMTYTSMH